MDFYSIDYVYYKNYFCFDKYLAEENYATYTLVTIHCSNEILTPKNFPTFDSEADSPYCMRNVLKLN